MIGSVFYHTKLNDVLPIMVKSTLLISKRLPGTYFSLNLVARRRQGCSNTLVSRNSG